MQLYHFSIETTTYQQLCADNGVLPHAFLSFRLSTKYNTLLYCDYEIIIMYNFLALL